MKSLKFIWREGKKILAFLASRNAIKLSEMGGENVIVPSSNSPLVDLIL